MLPRLKSTRPRRLAVVLASGMLLAGCFTGERPYFSDDPLAAGSQSGDVAIDSILARLDGVAASLTTFTATYTSLQLFGATQHSAAVAVAPQRRSVTVDSVRFLTEMGFPQTCNLTSGTCVDGSIVANISDTGLTPDFYAADSAKRLRRDAQAKIAPTVARTTTIADQPAQCVDVVVTGGTATYCVLDNGLLAKLTDGDITIDMQTFTLTIDEALFSSTN